jgi:gamma-glutamylcyclotransferase (GGCT)/AIG2-like uncharacterized protein YtfP
MTRSFFGPSAMNQEEAKDLTEDLKDTLPFIETTMTPDLPALNRWDSHYVFIFDDLKNGFSQSHILAEEPIMGVGYTRAPWFTMYQYKSRKNPPLMMIRQDSTKAGRVYGEVYKVSPTMVRDLDEIYSNQVWVRRLKIPIQITRIHDRRPEEVMAFAWVAQISVWKSRMDTLEALPMLTANKDKSFTYYNFTKTFDKAA